MATSRVLGVFECHRVFYSYSIAPRSPGPLLFSNSKIPIPILLLVPNFPLPPAEIPHRYSIDNTFLLIGFCFVLLQICEVFDRQNYAELTSFLFQKQSLEYLRR